MYEFELKLSLLLLLFSVIFSPIFWAQKEQEKEKISHFFEVESFLLTRVDLKSTSTSSRLKPDNRDSSGAEFLSRLSYFPDYPNLKQYCLLNKVFSENFPI